MAQSNNEPVAGAGAGEPIGASEGLGAATAADAACALIKSTATSAIAKAILGFAIFEFLQLLKIIWRMIQIKWWSYWCCIFYSAWDEAILDANWELFWAIACLIS